MLGTLCCCYLIWYHLCGCKWHPPVSLCRCLISGGCSAPHDDIEKCSERDVKFAFIEALIFMLLHLLCSFLESYSPELANKSFEKFFLT